MKIAYIAGPFRGPTPWDVECNIRRAEALALRVARCGVFPMCPHTNTRFFDKASGTEDSLWLNGDLLLLERAADCIVLTADYARSSGARAELNLAVELGLRVFVESEVELDASIREWALERAK